MPYINLMVVLFRIEKRSSLYTLLLYPIFLFLNTFLGELIGRTPLNKGETLSLLLLKDLTRDNTPLEERPEESSLQKDSKVDYLSPPEKGKDKWYKVLAVLMLIYFYNRTWRELPNYLNEEYVESRLRKIKGLINEEVYGEFERYLEHCHIAHAMGIAPFESYFFRWKWRFLLRKSVSSIGIAFMDKSLHLKGWVIDISLLNLFLEKPSSWIKHLDMDNWLGYLEIIESIYDMSPTLYAFLNLSEAGDSVILKSSPEEGCVIVSKNKTIAQKSSEKTSLTSSASWQLMNILSGMRFNSSIVCNRIYNSFIIGLSESIDVLEILCCIFDYPASLIEEFLNSLKDNEIMRDFIERGEVKNPQHKELAAELCSRIITVGEDAKIMNSRVWLEESSKDNAPTPFSKEEVVVLALVDGGIYIVRIPSHYPILTPYTCLKVLYICNEEGLQYFWSSCLIRTPFVDNHFQGMGNSWDQDRKFKLLSLLQKKGWNKDELAQLKYIWEFTLEGCLVGAFLIIDLKTDTLMETSPLESILDSAISNYSTFKPPKTIKHWEMRYLEDLRIYKNPKEALLVREINSIKLLLRLASNKER